MQLRLCRRGVGARPLAALSGTPPATKGNCMPSTNSHPDDCCSVCTGEGEIEICMVCANAVDNCECAVEQPTAMEECPECDGTGDANASEDNDQ